MGVLPGLPQAPRFTVEPAHPGSQERNVTLAQAKSGASQLSENEDNQSLGKVMIGMEEQPKKFIDVLGSRMAYVDEGEGETVVFLHGNPMSSYIWRNIIPHVSGLARCIAPDLIGMGDSDKLGGEDPGRYDFVHHRRYLAALLGELKADSNVILVGQDWGGALAMDWARTNQEMTRGIAYLETIVRPRTWDEMDPVVRSTFERLRSADGDALPI